MPAPLPEGIPSTTIPNGIDWADGLDGRPGTPVPVGAVRILGSGAFAGTDLQSVFLEEFPDSPDIELGQQGTIAHRFKMNYQLALQYLPALNRGVYLEDSFGNITRILTTRVSHRTGDSCELIITAESISFDNPPDEFQLDVIELNPALEKHPRYAFIPSDIRLLINTSISGATLSAQQEQINLINQISSRPGSPPSYQTASGATYSPSWSQVAAAAGELYLKRAIGEDTFYLPGFRIVWSQFFWFPPIENPGGYIEDPILQGGLPDYFWAVDGVADLSDSIFSQMALFNPQFFKDPTTGTVQISWLRLADHDEYQRTWHKQTHTWIGASYGHWDNQIYSNQPSPYPPPPLQPLGSQVL